MPNLILVQTTVLIDPKSIEYCFKCFYNDTKHGSPKRFSSFVPPPLPPPLRHTSISSPTSLAAARRRAIARRQPRAEQTGSPLFEEAGPSRRSSDCLFAKVSRKKRKKKKSKKSDAGVLLFNRKKRSIMNFIYF